LRPLLFLILEFVNVELKWDQNFLEEKSKKWRLKNPQKIIPKLTYNVFFGSLISFFIYPFLILFSFLWKEIGTYPVYKTLGILKSYSRDHGLGRPARLFWHPAQKKAKSRVGLTRLRPYPGPTPRRDRSR